MLQRKYRGPFPRRVEILSLENECRQGRISLDDLPAYTRDKIIRLRKEDDRAGIATPLKQVELRNSGFDYTVSGYAAVFNSPSLDMGFIERIVPGAFAKTLSQKPDVSFLINHEGLPLARTTSKMLTLSEDARGLKMQATLDGRDPDVQRIIHKMERRDLNRMSFAFRTIKDRWTYNRQLDTEIRELLELDLDGGDVSVVTWPAYPATSIAVGESP